MSCADAGRGLEAADARHDLAQRATDLELDHLHALGPAISSVVVEVITPVAAREEQARDLGWS